MVRVGSREVAPVTVRDWLRCLRWASETAWECERAREWALLEHLWAVLREELQAAEAAEEENEKLVY